MPKIIDLIKPEILGEYYNTTSLNDEPYFGESVFPADKKVGLDLSFIKGAGENTVLLKPSAFDSIAELRDRLNIETFETEMPLFRESMQIKEKEAQELMRLLNAPNTDAYVKAAIKVVYDDVANLVRSARRTAERMRMELLATGKIAIASVKNGVGSAYNYDYTAGTDFATKNQETLTSTATWNKAATATPIQDLRRWQDTIEDLTGTRPTNAIMTRKTLSYILAADEVKNHFTALNGGGRIISEKAVRELLMEELGLTIYVYNKKYTDYDGKMKNYFPDNKVTLFPDGDLGKTWYGTTNEEAQLMSGANTNVSVVDTGVAILSTINPHPVNETVYVAEIVLPSFERMNQIFIATVAE